MGRLSNATANAVLDALFGGTALPLATQIAVALSTTEPADDGSNVTEPSGSGYGRAVVDNDLTTWAAADSRSKTNAITVAFPDPTGDWGDLEWFAVYDDGSGDFLGWGLLSSVVTVGAGTTVAFDPGSLVFVAPGT
jgi:hypothetical protein